MTPRLLRAPAMDGGLLVDPPADTVGASMALNRSRLEKWNHEDHKDHKE